MILKILYTVLLFQISIFGSVDFTHLHTFQKRWTREEIEKRLLLFLQKDEKISTYYTLDDEKFILFDSPHTQKDRKEEFRLDLALQKTSSHPQRKKESLVGLKIAIDPGHFGGMYARLEERYIDISLLLEKPKRIQFDEGTLSLLTAFYLKTLLEKEGAIVFITREQIGKGAYPEDFFTWLSKNPNFWSENISLLQLFRKYYNPLDLRTRAEKINQFSPDLTIVIHYNSHHVKEKTSSNHCVTPYNYNLVFIPGAFFQTELNEYENRLEFLRLIVSEDLYHSLCLSRFILTQFEKYLCVPTVSKTDDVLYLDNVCLPVDKGIYARNLALTRLVHGPVCYGETLIQNNIDECHNLDKKDFVIGGIRCSSRIKQVAEAYFEGIKNYLLKTAIE